MSHDTTILPEITLNDAGIRNVRAPAKRWRIIGGAKSDYLEVHFETQAQRDTAAQQVADEFNESVMCEFWSFAHPQDDLNKGWASDGTIEPTQASPPVDQIDVDITIRLRLGSSSLTPEVSEALHALASVMAVQAEDGLYSHGSPDVASDDNEFVAEIVGCTITSIEESKHV